MPTREIYWNIVGGGWIYAFAILAGAFVAWGIWQRVRLWRLGQSETRSDHLRARLGGLLAEVLGQRPASRTCSSSTASSPR